MKMYIYLDFKICVANKIIMSSEMPKC